jgi:hypothetical protein
MWKENSTLIALFILVFVILGAFWWLNQQDSELGQDLPVMVSPAPVDQIDEAAVKSVLVKNYNKPQGDIDFTVLEVSGCYARGVATFKNDDRVWLWLAYEGGDGNWQLVHDGQGVADCRQLAEVDFPPSLAGQCWDSQAKTIIDR